MPGSGNGATAPGGKPVAATTSSRVATLAEPAPTALAIFAPSARRSPGTRATTGRPSQTKTRVLTIWPASTPSALATSRTVGISAGNSSSRASPRAVRRKSATRWTGSGSTAKPYRLFPRCLFDEHRAGAPCHHRVDLSERQRADRRKRAALRGRRGGVRMRMRGPLVHAPAPDAAGRLRARACEPDPLPARPRARRPGDREGGDARRALPRRGEVRAHRRRDGAEPQSTEGEAEAGLGTNAPGTRAR